MRARRQVLVGLPLPEPAARTNAEYKPKVMPTPKSAQGWADYLAARPYPKEYDEWSQIDQRHYERGRLRAAGAHLVYTRVPSREPADIVQKTNGLRLVPPPALKGWRR